LLVTGAKIRADPLHNQLLSRSQPGRCHHSLGV
jgi:hypothetical protein